METTNREPCQCSPGECANMQSDTIKCLRAEHCAMPHTACEDEGVVVPYSSQRDAERFVLFFDAILAYEQLKPLTPEQQRIKTVFAVFGDDRPKTLNDVRTMIDRATGYAPPVSVHTESENVQYVRNLARACVNIAAEYGCAVTIEQRPLLPLAMGNYESVIDVQPKRGR